tara:strand:+ start:322 stop:468 length:147 start_codon:yes stop_codon:yes gene_type:complete
MSSAKIRIILGDLVAKVLVIARREVRKIRFVFIEFLRAFLCSKNKSIE